MYWWRSMEMLRWLGKARVAGQASSRSSRKSFDCFGQASKVLTVPSKISAGLLMYRRTGGRLEVFLAHPGGPFFASKDAGHWTIPKGEVEPDEDHLATAIREFKEEIGIDIDPKSSFIDLGTIQQKGGKTVRAWAVEQDCPEPFACKSNLFEMQWPPRSGKWQSFPEVDRAQFFSLEEARARIKDTQLPLIDRLDAAVRTTPEQH